MNRDLLFSDLEAEEGFRPYVYDDATGIPIVIGTVVKGNPTIGIGWAPGKNPLMHTQALIILGWHVDDKWETLQHAAPWIDAQPEPVQRALCNLAFNLGVTGLLKFTTFMALVEQGKYQEAADDLDTTAWGKQVQKTRVDTIKKLIKQGQT